MVDVTVNVGASPLSNALDVYMPAWPGRSGGGRPTMRLAPFVTVLLTNSGGSKGSAQKSTQFSLVASEHIVRVFKGV